jgi:hypothetical protein
VPDLFEHLTEGGDERTTALYRLALLTGAVRLPDANLEKISNSNYLKAWFAEKLQNPDIVFRLAEVASAVSLRELRGHDEENSLSLDNFGFPVILEPAPEIQRKRGFATQLAGKQNSNGKGGDDNASA